MLKKIIRYRTRDLVIPASICIPVIEPRFAVSGEEGRETYWTLIAATGTSHVAYQPGARVVTMNHEREQVEKARDY